jgi:hypothetical protein
MWCCGLFEAACGQVCHVMACCYGRVLLPTAWTIKPRSGDSTGKSRHVPVLGLKHLKLLRRSGHSRATGWPCREHDIVEVRSGSAVTAPTGAAECGSSVPLAAEPPFTRAAG